MKRWVLGLVAAIGLVVGYSPPATAIWGSTGDLQYFWGSTGDLPVVGDYDGDDRVDVGIFRPSSGTWYILLVTRPESPFAVIQYGQPGDVPVAADYDGDGRLDLAVFRPSTGAWYIRYSHLNSLPIS